MIYYVLFRIVDVRLAFPLVDVQEILPRPVLRSTPGMPSLLAGEFMLDGQMATVLRLDRILELAEWSPGLYAHLLRLSHVEPPCLLVVDEVCAVVALPEARAIPAGRAFNECVTGWVDWAGRAWHLLDRGRLLRREERLAVAEFAERAQARLAKLDPA